MKQTTKAWAQARIPRSQRQAKHENALLVGTSNEATKLRVPPVIGEAAGCALHKKEQAGQHAMIVNRVLVGIEGRGTLRTAAEDFNLSVNLHPHDVTNAEFFRTFRVETFPGKAYLTLLQRVRRDAAVQRVEATKRLQRGGRHPEAPCEVQLHLPVR